ncbi:MAG: 4-hydroxy-tetrahydrodipicolinate reductase [Clostridia bacterium]|nr:4-hydroxy-tetrahydrodipicolinate reductase [Clostridia bacterium]
MTRIILSGCLGRMGRAVCEAAALSGRCTVIAGIDAFAGSGTVLPFPVYTSPDEIPADFERPDVLVDFSHHTALPGLLAYAKKYNVPLVIATTGHTEEELSAMHDAAKDAAIFYSRNMSLGINLLILLCKKAAQVLGEDFDIEIIEKHHNKKLDAPSGTALMLADAISETFDGGKDYVYERQSVRRQREKREIGIHAVRGGTIVGQHDVLFAGKDETITLAHEATSREVFATGALKAAEFMVGKSAGLYDMNDLLKDVT